VRDAHATFALVFTGVHDVTFRSAEPLVVAAHVWRFVWRGLDERMVIRVA
jgi:hypothetical protein